MIRLYPYQLEMKERMASALQRKQSIMVQMPTGTGKTCVLTSFVADWLMQHEGEVWMVTHRRELVDQVRDTWHRTCLRLEGNVAVDADRVKTYSIQWLTRHYAELQSQPSLIVIDEAHHAVAKTYAQVIAAYPQAKKVGVTATPCRMSGQGFGALFDELLTTHGVKQFIAEGYLARFDYVSLSPTSADQQRINQLQRRAADGDYCVAEMQQVLDTRPTIRRLCQTVQQYVSHQKGIVYAINIAHAEHIAAAYRDEGIKAQAISSHTPSADRCALIEQFKRTDGSALQVLVNVDLFGEGFDCPDVEFIQLARPTLSLAKYLQMVGRGLRVARGKSHCTVLDNVGLYRLFGLPTTAWNWQALFAGQVRGRGEANAAREWAMCMVQPRGIVNCASAQQYAEMVMIARHDQPQLADELRQLQQQLQQIKQQPLHPVRYGFRGSGWYVRTEGSERGLYRTTNEVRQGWRVVSKQQQGHTIHYLLNEANERLVRIGHKRPWGMYADGVTERYATAHSQRLVQLVCVNETDYIVLAQRCPLNEGMVQKDEWGKDTLATFVYYGLSRSKHPEAYARYAYVCKHYLRDEYAICNNHHHVILSGLCHVKLHDDNIAEVAFVGEKGLKRWVNLYTMQEFSVCPVVEGNRLRVGNVYFSYKDRQQAGIPFAE